MPTATTTRARRAGADVAQETAGQSRRVARDAAGEARGVASGAAQRGSAVAQQAKDEARDVVETARARASEVTEEISSHGRSLLEQTTSQLEQQAQQAAQQAAGSFQKLGSEAQALAEGRPEDAPVLTEYAWKVADGAYGAADRLHELANDVETRGFTGVLDDLSTYARRRPGAFLLGAALVGFGIGRVVKAESARRQSGDGVQATQAGDGQAEAPAPRQAITTRAGAR
jgi:hypothetical protein